MLVLSTIFTRLKGSPWFQGREARAQALREQELQHAAEKLVDRIICMQAPHTRIAGSGERDLEIQERAHFLLLKIQDAYGIWHPEHVRDIEGRAGFREPFDKAFDRFTGGIDFEEWRRGIYIDYEYQFPEDMPDSPFNIDIHRARIEKCQRPANEGMVTRPA